MGEDNKPKFGGALYMLNDGKYKLVCENLNVQEIKIESEDKEMNNLEELEKKYEELGKEIERLKNKKDNKRWRAKKDEQYCIVASSGVIFPAYEQDDEADEFRYSIGNYFKTEEEAEKQLKKLKIYMQLKDLADRLNGYEEKGIDWEDSWQNKYYICYDYDDNRLTERYNQVMKSNNIYCLDEYFLDKAIKEIGEENLKLLFDVESEEE